MRTAKIRLEPVGTRPQVVPERPGNSRDCAEMLTGWSGGNSGYRTTVREPSRGGRGSGGMLGRRSGIGVGCGGMRQDCSEGGFRRDESQAERSGIGSGCARLPAERMAWNCEGLNSHGHGRGFRRACESAGTFFRMAGCGARTWGKSARALTSAATAWPALPRALVLAFLSPQTNQPTANQAPQQPTHHEHG